MLSVATARLLRALGLTWSPSPGDRFVIADRGMDDEVFVVSDLTIETHDHPTGRVLGFNGTTEWALDSVAVEQALWLPREDQLREALGDAFVALRREPARWSVGQDGAGDQTTWTSARAAEEAYALAVVTQRSDGTPRSLLPVAAEGFSWRVHAVPPDRWGAPTPATEWTVRDVVNHLVGEHLWAPHLLRGETLEEVGDRYEGDQLGDDPAAAWESAVGRSLRAWAEADDDTPVHTSMGQIPAREYAEQMLLDLTVHAWDLARGAGSDDRLDGTCVRHVLEHVGPQVDALQGSGLFAPPVPTTSQDPQDRLLALLGRDPA
jgi:uncharacterized protein (TIGR03086 family)